VCTPPSVQPILALLGHPVAGNPAQFMMERAFARHEMDWRYLSLDVSPEDLADAVRGMRAMGFHGGTCAEPHKEAVLGLLDRASDVARHIGAVNCILRDHHELLGENTEGRGVVSALGRRIDPAGKRIVLLGAGRLARAVGVELALAKAAEIIIVNRTEERGRKLVELLSGPVGAAATLVPWDEDYVLPPDVNVLISTIPPSPDDPDEPLPIKLDHLNDQMVVVDVSYNPPGTWLAGHAAERGAAVIEGLEVFIDQAAVDFQLWTGVDPDPTVMREAVEEFLEL
jgi:shikimate dehydrogenase